ncbi:MAG: hypothetical protein HFE73_08495 [Firmicutes bacterium]|nr:hypothetical protein [Bacillota bacterium]
MKDETGKKIAFLVEEHVYEQICDNVKDAFENREEQYIYIFHCGEDSYVETLRIETILRENCCGKLVAVGRQGDHVVFESAKKVTMQMPEVEMIAVVHGFEETEGLKEWEVEK